MTRARARQGASTAISVALALIWSDCALAQQKPPLDIGRRNPPSATGIIGEDDRAASTANAVARIRKNDQDRGICTAWLISNGAFLSAGHCFTEQPAEEAACRGSNFLGMNVIEFDVPLSTSTGLLNPSAPIDTFLIDQNSIQCDYSNSPSLANTSDWAVFGAVVQKNRPLPAEDRGQFFRVTRPMVTSANVSPKPGVRVTGYGVDGPRPDYGYGQAPKNRYAGAQQTAVGPYVGETNEGRYYNLSFGTDLTAGVSGGPVIANGTRQAFGIAVLSGVTLNTGTSFSTQNLSAAIHAFPGTRTVPVVGGANIFYVDSGNPNVSELAGSLEGKIFRPYTTLTRALGRVANTATPTLISVVTGNYPELRDDLIGLSPYIDITVGMTADIVLDLPVGNVTIWTAQRNPL